MNAIKTHFWIEFKGDKSEKVWLNLFIPEDVTEDHDAIETWLEDGSKVFELQDNYANIPSIIWNWGVKSTTLIDHEFPTWNTTFDHEKTLSPKEIKRQKREEKLLIKKQQTLEKIDEHEIDLDSFEISPQAELLIKDKLFGNINLPIKALRPIFDIEKVIDAELLNDLGERIMKVSTSEVWNKSLFKDRVWWDGIPEGIEDEGYIRGFIEGDVHIKEADWEKGKLFLIGKHNTIEIDLEKLFRRIIFLKENNLQIDMAKELEEVIKD